MVRPKPIPFPLYIENPVINDQIGRIPVGVFFDTSTLSGTVFDRRLEDDTILTFKESQNPRLVLDEETQSEWDVLTGTAVSGDLEGIQLEQVPITYSFWFGWIDYHTESDVYRSKRS